MFTLSSAIIIILILSRTSLPSAKRIEQLKFPVDDGPNYSWIELKCNSRLNKEGLEYSGYERR